jgi:CBS domain-containing protein
MANAAFFFGMMAGMVANYPDIRTHLRFEDVKSNFLGAARAGIRAQLNWFGDTYVPVQQLIEKELLPLAREGLQRMHIDSSDIDRFLGVIEERVRLRRTGARWALESLENMQNKGTSDQRMRCLVSSLVEQQSTGQPISKWVLAEFHEQQNWRESYRHVSQFMTTDLLTVRPDDLVDFAATLMDWHHVRHIPVEDDAGCLIGLVSHRALLRLVANGGFASGQQQVTVKQVMTPDPITVAPETDTMSALRLIRDKHLACLPVTRGGKLLGLVTERDLIVVASHLLEACLTDGR